MTKICNCEDYDNVTLPDSFVNMIMYFYTGKKLIVYYVFKTVWV